MGEPQLASGAGFTARATSVRWTIVGFIVLLAFVLYLLRLNLSVAGEAIMGELGLSAVQFGFVLGAFEWSYALCQFPGGLFGNRVGGRRALTWLPIAWGVVTLLCGLCPQAHVRGALFALVALFALRLLL